MAAAASIEAAADGVEQVQGGRLGGAPPRLQSCGHGRHGRRPGPPDASDIARTGTSARAAASPVVYLAAAVTGLSAVFVAVPAAYLVLEVAGAAYLLLYLAWQALRPGGRNVFAPQSLPHDPPRRLVGTGLVTNLLNPEIAVLSVALLPQFVDPARGSVALQSLVLGATQITVALTVDALIVVSAGAVASFLGGRPAWLRAQRRLMGAVLGGLAVRLLAERTPAAAR